MKFEKLLIEFIILVWIDLQLNSRRKTNQSSFSQQMEWEHKQNHFASSKTSIQWFESCFIVCLFKCRMKLNTKWWTRNTTYINSYSRAKKKQKINWMRNQLRKLFHQFKMKYIYLCFLTYFFRHPIYLFFSCPLPLLSQLFRLFFFFLASHFKCVTSKSVRFVHFIAFGSMFYKSNI